MAMVTRTAPHLGKKRRRTDRQDTLRAERFAAQRTLRVETSLERVKACMWTLNGEFSDQVAVKLSEGTAGLSGVQTCGSPWACPVCSQKIMTQRAADVQEAVTRWHKGHMVDYGYGKAEVKGRIVFATFTMRHSARQELATLWDGLSGGWHEVIDGRDWREDQERFGVLLPREVKSGVNKGEIRYGRRINFVRAVEVTHGRNGWHVHIHSLLFVKDGITDDEVSALGDSMFSRWSDALVAQGLRAPSRENGVDVRLVRRDDSNGLGDYFSKNVYVGRVEESGAGWEIAGAAGKKARRGNRTPFQILADIVIDGDADDLDLWREYETGSFNRRQMTWSGTLRDVLDLQPEKTDKNIVEEDHGGEVVLRIPKELWYGVISWNIARLLELVEAGHTEEHIFTVLLHPDPGERAAA
jgi:hypothetical protein